MSGTNTVEVDPAALLAEAQRAVSGAEPDPAAMPAEPAPGEAPAAPGLEAASWRPLVAGLTPPLRMTMFAQWSIPPDMEREFVDSLGATLDLLFPGGLDGKYAAVARLFGVCAGIVFANYAANGNKLPPLGLKKPDDKKPSGDTSQQRAPS